MGVVSFFHAGTVLLSYFIWVMPKSISTFIALFTARYKIDKRYKNFISVKKNIT